MLVTKKFGADYIVNLKGRIDNHEGKSLELDINRLIDDNKDSSFILNLSEVEYLSSSGIRIFLTCSRKIKENKQKLAICELQESVIKILQAARVYDHLPIVATENEAKEII